MAESAKCTLSVSSRHRPRGLGGCPDSSVPPRRYGGQSLEELNYALHVGTRFHGQCVSYQKLSHKHQASVGTERSDPHRSPLPEGEGMKGTNKGRRYGVTGIYEIACSTTITGSVFRTRESPTGRAR